MPTLKELHDTLVTERGNMASFLETYQDGSGGFKSTPANFAGELSERNNKLAQLNTEYEAVRQADESFKSNQSEMRRLEAFRATVPSFQHPKGGPDEPGTGQIKSLGDYFVDSAVYQDRHKNGTLDGSSLKMRGMDTSVTGVSVKTLFATGAGYAPFIPRTDTLILSPQRRPVVADLIPQLDTLIPGTKYMEETLFTNNAAAVAEGGIKPESAFTFTERTVGMSKIATSLPVTEEQMMDVPQIRGIVDDRLTLQLKLEEERELLQGNPGGSNSSEILGFLNKAGTQTIAKGANAKVLDDFSANLYMITEIESTVGFANVTGIVMHPMDWFAMRTIQDSTGRYVMGNPDQVGPAVLWGKPVIPTIAMPQGTILMGDFAGYSQILRREGITFRVGYVNAQFLTNTMTILCEERLVLIIYRPVAFGTVTGTF